MGVETLYVVIPKIPDVTTEEDIKRLRQSVLLWESAKRKVTTLVVSGETYGECYNKAIEQITEGYVWFVYPHMTLKEDAGEELFGAVKSGTQLLLFGYERLCWNEPEQILVEEDEFTGKTFADKMLTAAEDVRYNALWNKWFSISLIREKKLAFSRDMKEGYGVCFLFSYLSYCERIQCKSVVACRYIELEKKELPVKERIAEKHRMFLEYKRYEEIKNPGSDTKAVDRYLRDYIVYERVRLFESEGAERKEAKELLKKEGDLLRGGKLYENAYISQAVLRSVLGPKHRKKLVEEAKRKRKATAERKRVEAFVSAARRACEEDRKQAEKVRKEKHILMYCEDSTMVTHMWDYYECIKSCKDVKLFLYYKNNFKEEALEGVTLLKDPMEVQGHFWNLIACTDAAVPYENIPMETKLLYVNHGLHMISYDGGESLYAYSMGRGISKEGEPLFDAYLEPNSRYAGKLVEENEKLAGHIFHVGYKNAEKVLAERERYEEIRETFGIAPGETVVAVFGSWGKDSLFHKLGNDFLEQAEELGKKGYRFILSIHPKEYGQYDPDITPLGPVIDSMEEKGFLVRKPGTDSAGYMAMADLVISDYSTMCEEAMLAGKTVILSEFPVERVWKFSTMADYRKKGPVLYKDGSLEELLKACKADESFGKLCTGYAEELLPPNCGYRQGVKQVTELLLKTEKE